MYELEFIRKRKKRRLAVIIGSVGTMGVTTFSIVAFLGRYVGTFTVSLEAKNVDLTLSESSSFADSSSFLRVNEVPPFQEFTYKDFSKFGDEVIDSEQSDVYLGANPDKDSLNFFKYTFFLKNVGFIPAKYDLSLRIKESVASSDGRTLDDTLRVMVYDNGVSNVYASPLSVPHKDENGNLDYRAPISVDEDKATLDYPFEGYANMFVSSNEVMNQSEVELGVGEVKRYTIVTWLEGFRSSNTQKAPKGASIKLGVEINAYENE